MSRRLSQEARRKAIEAAQALVAELGVDRFTVDGVSRRSGVAKTTLYRHWKSGTELLIDAVGQCMEQPVIHDVGSLRAELTSLLEQVGDHLGHHSDRKLLMGLVAAAMSNPELQRLREAVLAQRLAPARQIVQRAVDRGEIPPIDTDLAAHVVLGPFLGRALAAAEPITPGQLADLVEIIARGLGAAEQPRPAPRQVGKHRPDCRSTDRP